MLIEFSCANFKCFADEARLQLTPSSNRQHPEHISEVAHGISALRISAIYGANASGKTKFVEAMKYAKKLITTDRRRNVKLQVHPFALDSNKLTEPSRFEFVFVKENVLYTYGFVVDSSSIVEEWLFYRSKGREYKCFERLTHKSGKVEFELGSGIGNKGSSALRLFTEIAKQATSTQMLLTRFADMGALRPQAAFNWLDQDLVILDAASRYRPLEFRAHKDEAFSDFLGTYLCEASTGIASVGAVAEKYDSATHKLDLDPTVLQQRIDALMEKNGSRTVFHNSVGNLYQLSNENGDLKIYRLVSIHKGKNEIPVEFEFSEESSGTQRLAHLIPALYDLKINNKVYVIDELDRMLHPLLTRNLIKKFADTNFEKSSQLIFTTHETNLLDQDLLRRDEIWFVEKNPSTGASELFSLADFEIRNDLKLEKGYLNGRFGAIPYFQGGKVINIFESEEEQ